MVEILTLDCNFEGILGAGTKFKRNSGLYGTSDVDPSSLVKLVKKICPKAILNFA